VRWWPSGVPQGASVVATGVAVFAALSKIGGLTPRARVVSSLVAAGVSTANITIQSVMENSVGFNRFMWGISEYQKTQKWPSLDQLYAKSDTEIEDFSRESIKQMTPADQAVVDSIVQKSVDSTSSSSTTFLPSLDVVCEYLINIYEKLFREVLMLFQPVAVKGNFDDLIGQRMFIEFILFMACILLVYIL